MQNRFNEDLGREDRRLGIGLPVLAYLLIDHTLNVFCVCFIKDEGSDH